MIYFDQAASSYPKPSEVGEAMIYALNEIGANASRGNHKLAREAADLIAETRETASRVFGCSDPNSVLFNQNATVGLNQAIKGFRWSEGDHVIATEYEHNSVRRPLEFIKTQYGVNVTYLPITGTDRELVRQIEQSITPHTALIVMPHASNVTGFVTPVEQISSLTRQHQIPLLVDASQTAGHQPLHMKNMGVDMMALPGHKGLMGPQGTGLLMVEGDVDLHPLHHGGTGNNSENPEQPLQWPEKLESGTLNTPGIAGLGAALKVYEAQNHDNVSRETILTQKLVNGLEEIEGITCYGPGEHNRRMPIAAFNVLDISSQEIALVLDSHYDIAVRGGVHCSPLTHESLHTGEQGVVRASLGRYNTEEEVTEFLQAISEIAESYKLL